MPRRSGKGGPTEKERSFAINYVMTGKVFESYAAAGYAVRNRESAGTIASKLLLSPQVSQLVKEARVALAKNAQLSADEVMQELALITKSDIGNIIDFDAIGLGNVTPEVRRTISSIKIKFYPPSKSPTQPAPQPTPSSPDAPPDGQAAIVAPAPWQGRAIESVEVRLWNKNDAIVNYMKRLGLLKQDLTLDALLDQLGPLGVQIRGIMAAFGTAKGEIIDQQLPPTQQLENGAQVNVEDSNEEGQEDRKEEDKGKQDDTVA